MRGPIRTSLICRTSLTALLLASTVFACTAVEGADPIGDSNRIAWTLGSFSLVFVVVTIATYYLRNRQGLPSVIISVILLAIHPAWTMSAYIGDCGFAKVDYSKWFTGFGAALLVFQLFCLLRTKATSPKT